MKVYLIIILGAFFGVEGAAQEISYPEKDIPNSNFELKISNIGEIKGEVRIAVFNSEKKYNEKEDPIHTVVLKVEKDSLVWQQKQLPYGEYAIAVYHDVNENGELDTNFLGIPKEAYGFSNNARGRFGPASWEDAHFKVDEYQHSIEIKIK